MGERSYHLIKASKVSKSPTWMKGMTETRAIRSSVSELFDTVLQFTASPRHIKLKTAIGMMLLGAGKAPLK